MQCYSEESIVTSTFKGNESIKNLVVKFTCCGVKTHYSHKFRIGRSQLTCTHRLDPVAAVQFSILLHSVFVAGLEYDRKPVYQRHCSILVNVVRCDPK